MKYYFFLIILVFSFQNSIGQLKEPIYNVYEFGATGDGKSNDQKAIQAAINKCKETGGTVLLEDGDFLTGQINLVDNMILFVDSTATILGVQSIKVDDYPYQLINTVYPNRMLEDCQRRLIYGDNVKNVTITGGGTINGQGDFAPWKNVKELGTEKDRPSILAFVGSKNITVSNITLLNPACWTQVFIESDDIHIKNIIVNTGSLSPNRDGIDIVDCHNVLIEESFIQSEDDGICFKSGSEYGCKNAVVRNTVIDKLNVPAGNCFKLGTDGLGSFMNFEVSGLTLKNAYQNSAIVIESMDGAVIDNIEFHDIEIENCGQAFFILLADRMRTVPGREPRIGTISNISFRDVRGKNFTQQYPSIITGIEGHNIQNVIFENIDLKLKGGIESTEQTVMEYDGKYPEGSKFGNTNASGFFIRHSDLITFKDCKITLEEEDARPIVVDVDVIKMNKENSNF
ncbi:glycoside hydrolase family 28 protein [Autumnicola psychrophila]|uniref:Glycosyl hydrolase family 28 protein n=1 Tax=Autumnicola psychrophila TaxID=3075592 RepID=A0ABU3DU16_9FLAO|nr:glycosyl hydrolase family 28 protein [Zunongwangia sp. F225]MDT0687216.1 glycosyl hydrolase family 28 protein [Zunongwangia sp. F225]